MIRKIKKKKSVVLFKRKYSIYGSDPSGGEKALTLSAGRWRSVEKNRYSTTLMDL